MKKKLYVIQFKVEGDFEFLGGARGNNDDDDGEKEDGDDTGMEEIEHDMDPKVGHIGGTSKGSKNNGQCSGNSSTPAGSRKVANWASLFQSG
jgi:hypothetical protein